MNTYLGQINSVVKRWWLWHVRRQLYHVVYHTRTHARVTCHVTSCLLTRQCHVHHHIAKLCSTYSTAVSPSLMTTSRSQATGMLSSTSFRIQRHGLGLHYQDQGQRHKFYSQGQALQDYSLYMQARLFWDANGETLLATAVTYQHWACC